MKRIAKKKNLKKSVQLSYDVLYEKISSLSIEEFDLKFSQMMVNIYFIC